LSLLFLGNTVDVAIAGIRVLSVQECEGFPPWLFFTSDHHDPLLYGYRGLIVDWDYTSAAAAAVDRVAGSWGAATTAFRLNGEDEASFPDEADPHPDDFHRLYCPYRRLVGAGVVDRFNRRAAATEPAAEVEMRASSSLAEFVRRLHGPSYSRDQLQPVYRPIVVPPATDRDHPETGKGDDSRCATVDDRDRSARAMVQSQPEHPTTTTVAITVTPPAAAASHQLPVVLEDEDWADETELDQEPVWQRRVMVNGERHATGNGNRVCEAEVVGSGTGNGFDAGDVRVNGPGEVTTTVVTQTTIVRQVNGSGGVSVAETAITDDSPARPVNGSVYGVTCATTGLADIGLDAVKTSCSDYIIDETNRRTIRSDL